MTSVHPALTATLKGIVKVFCKKCLLFEQMTREISCQCDMFLCFIVHRLSCNDCLEDKRELIGTVLHCIVYCSCAQS